MARPEKTDNELFAVTSDGAKLKYMGDAIISRFTKMSDHIQHWAVSAALHAAVHKDFTEIPRVLDSLSKRGFRSNALAAWFVNPKVGAPVNWVKPNKAQGIEGGWEFDSVKAKALAERYAAEPDGVVALLVGIKYYDLTKESTFDGLSLPAKLNALLKEAMKVAGDDKKKGHTKNNFKGLDGLRQLVDSVNAKVKTTPTSEPTDLPPAGSAPVSEGSPALAETVH